MATRTAASRQRATTRPPGRRDSRRPARPVPSRAFAELLLDALTGRRAAAGVIKAVSPEVYDRLWALAEAGTLRQRRGAPGWRLLACRHCVPAAGVLEVCAVIGTGHRTRALAFRLESVDGVSWRCTALETG